MFSLGKNPNRALINEWFRVGEECFERRQRARAHRFDLLVEGGQDVFESAAVDDRGRRCFAYDILQKGAFALVGLDEMDQRARRFRIFDCRHKPRKSGARAEIEPTPRLGHSAGDLERIGEMPNPEIVQARLADEIEGALPFFEEICVVLQPPQRLVGQAGEERVRGSWKVLFAFGNAQDLAPARRSFAAKRVMAAGVMPSIRPACPMVRGRMRSSRDLISLERPGSRA
jgi:hypothetical protein